MASLWTESVRHRHSHTTGRLRQVWDSVSFRRLRCEAALTEPTSPSRPRVPPLYSGPGTSIGTVLKYTHYRKSFHLLWFGNDECDFGHWIRIINDDFTWIVMDACCGRQPLCTTMTNLKNSSSKCTELRHRSETIEFHRSGPTCQIIIFVINMEFI